MWDNICDYNEGYTKADAEYFGWCRTCRISSCRKRKCHSNNNVMYMSPNDYAKIIDKKDAEISILKKLVEYEKRFNEFYLEILSKHIKE